MKLALALIFTTLLIPAVASACGGERTETRLPADGATDVPLNTRVYLGGFGPGAFGAGRAGVTPNDGWQPVLIGPDGPVAVTLEVMADGRAWWALARPTEPLQPNTEYTVAGGDGTESRFTTGAAADTTPPPPPMSVVLTPTSSDPCQPTTCGDSSLLEVEALPAPPSGSLFRVFVYAEGESDLTMVGVVPADAYDWGVGVGSAYNNVRAFPPGDVSSLGLNEIMDAMIGKSLCVVVKVEDLAGNAPSPVELAEACGVLPDPRPSACPTTGDASSGEISSGEVSPDAGTPADASAATDTEVSPTSAAGSSGCQSARRSQSGAWFLMISVLCLFWRRRSEGRAR